MTAATERHSSFSENQYSSLPSFIYLFLFVFAVEEVQNEQMSDNSPLNGVIHCYTRNPWEIFHFFFYLDKPDGLRSGVKRGALNLLTGVASGFTGGYGFAASSLKGSRILSKMLCFLFVFSASSATGAVCGASQVCRGLTASLQWSMNETRRMLDRKAVDNGMEAGTFLNLRVAFAELPSTDADLEQKAFQAYVQCQQQENTNSSRIELMNHGGTETTHRDCGQPDGQNNHGGEYHQGKPYLNTTSTYYSVLGVSSTETTENITQAYRSLALKKHPDRVGNTPAAVEAFQEINAAYKVLSNPIQREAYNTMLRNGLVGGPETGSFTGNNNASLPNAVNVSSVLHDPLFSAAEPLIGQLPIFLLTMPCHFYTRELRKELEHRFKIRLAHRITEYIEAGSRAQQEFVLLVSDLAGFPSGKKLLLFVAEEYSRVAMKFSSHLLWKNVTVFSSMHRGWSWVRNIFTLGKALHHISGASTLEEDFVTSLIFSLSERQIRETVREASLMALHDTSITKEEQARRAQGLKQLSSLIYDRCAC